MNYRTHPRYYRSEYIRGYQHRQADVYILPGWLLQIFPMKYLLSPKTSDFFIKHTLKTSNFFIIWYPKTSDFFIKCTLKTSDFFKIIVSHHAFIQIKALSLQKIGCTRQSEIKFSLCSFALSLQKIDCTRQSEIKLSLCSFALSLHCKSTK